MHNFPFPKTMNVLSDIGILPLPVLETYNFKKTSVGPLGLALQPLPQILHPSAVFPLCCHTDWIKLSVFKCSLNFLCGNRGLKLAISMNHRLSLNSRNLETERPDRYCDILSLLIYSKTSIVIRLRCTNAMTF